MTPSVPIPMNRRSFPTGQTTTALLKALLRTLSAEKGTAVADTWLRGIRMIRDDLEDETRLLPLPTMHGALASFAARPSRPRRLPASTPPTASMAAPRAVRRSTRVAGGGVAA